MDKRISISRRTFTKVAATAAVGYTAMGGTRAFSAAKRRNIKKSLKMGMIQEGKTFEEIGRAHV